MEEDAVTDRIISCAIKVHKALGPGLLESAYQISLEEEFDQSDLKFKSQLALPLVYGGRRTRKGYRIDFLVEESVVVEVKAERRIQLLDFAQVQTYLRLLNLRVGLIPQLQHSVDEDRHCTNRQSRISLLS
jgi:GxxExxY protein